MMVKLESMRISASSQMTYRRKNIDKYALIQVYGETHTK